MVYILLVAITNCFFFNKSIKTGFACGNIEDKNKKVVAKCADANTKRNWGVGSVTHWLCKN